VTHAYEYVGTELSLFAQARNWKRYLAAQLRPFVQGHVLEVGAGIGATTSTLWSPSASRWTALEPDSGLANQARVRLEAIGLEGVTVRVGTVANLDSAERFDTILYIDVLEHIEEDAAQLQAAACHLAPGAYLIVLSPAHEWLFSPFDAAIGHVRRYNAKQLQAVGPSSLTLARLRYLDAVGMAASLANRLLLRRAMPNAAQIAVWDRFMVPISRVLDACLAFRLGKSILAVWRRPSEP
jgi:2-polyprenyl-3-methyl-5-hydroxy-6-metoxy-1,4-benzoquinol methylase